MSHVVVFALVCAALIGVTSSNGDFGGSSSGDFCRTVLNCYQCKKDPAICDECNHILFFLDTDVYPPVCRNCSELSGCLGCLTKTRCLLCRDPGYNGPDLDSPIGTCSPCAADCTSCNKSGSGKCDTCKPSYYRTTDGLCQQCDPRCLSCSYGDGGFCYTCQSGYVADENGKCHPCTVPNCAKCTISQICTKCKNGKTPSAKGSCSCSDNCLSCDIIGFGLCDVCQTGYQRSSTNLCEAVESK